MTYRKEKEPSQPNLRESRGSSSRPDTIHHTNGRSCSVCGARCTLTSKEDHETYGSCRCDQHQWQV